jgi:hypothetical protein
MSDLPVGDTTICKWKDAAARSHDFGNHIMRHLGAATYKEGGQSSGTDVHR